MAQSRSSTMMLASDRLQHWKPYSSIGHQYCEEEPVRFEILLWWVRLIDLEAASGL